MPRCELDTEDYWAIQAAMEAERREREGEAAMRVFGLWNGGHGAYSPGQIETDGETWDSLAAAKQSLLDRWRHGYWNRDTSASAIVFDDDGCAKVGEVGGYLHPNVQDDSYIDLYPAERLDDGRWRVAAAPYCRLSIRTSHGSSGGVRTERF